MDPFTSFLSRHFDVDTFDFANAPLSSLRALLSGLVLYFGAIFACKLIAKHSKTPLKLRTFAVLHSGFLSVASLWMLVNIVRELSKNYAAADKVLKTSIVGHVEIFIDSSSLWKTGRLVFFLYLNYLFKYYELIDTLLMALKGKPIIFLHWYHHAATLILAWTQLNWYCGMQWIVVCLNLSVHIAMYAYYALSALGVRCWWKRYITVMHIAQFILDLAISLPLTVAFFWHSPGAWYPKPSSSSGAAIFALLLLTSYLILFVVFYKRVYKKREKREEKREKREELPAIIQNGASPIARNNQALSFHEDTTSRRRRN